MVLPALLIFTDNVKNLFALPTRNPVDKGRPDYYVTPSRDFTKYTKDCADKYWNKETAFDWSQNVQDNLRQNLENLSEADFERIAFMALPVIEETLERKLQQIRRGPLPLEEDALKSIQDCLPSDSASIQKALELRFPLRELQSSLAIVTDQTELLQAELVDLRAQQKLGFVKSGTYVKRLETAEEKQAQDQEVERLSKELHQLEKTGRQLQVQCVAEEKELKTKKDHELQLLRGQLVRELEEAKAVVQQLTQMKHLPIDPVEVHQLKELIFKRQLSGLKDIANHALVVEQSAIAPLTMGIIHYKRHREIQEAMTTFINDEAKHSATFRRFLAEKLEAKEFISDKLIKGADRYMWIARFMPGAGLFLAVIVEAIGAAVLEFFAKEEYMPSSLFCSICHVISCQDEVRHLNLCVDMYNELFRKGRRWEVARNHIVLKKMMTSVYGDKSEDHPLIQAFRVFGVDASVLYQHIADRLSGQLARISMYVEPEKILEYMGRK